MCILCLACTLSCTSCIISLTRSLLPPQLSTTTTILLLQPNYVPTIEDDIESRRQTLVAELKKTGKGTKITPETFKIWNDKKIKVRQAAAKKLVEAELRKKKGGKGLSVLSGRALYEYKRELFRDRDDDDMDEGNGRPEANGGEAVAEVAAKVQSDLFLDGDDADLDDLED